MFYILFVVLMKLFSLLNRPNDNNKKSCSVIKYCNVHFKLCILALNDHRHFQIVGIDQRLIQCSLFFLRVSVKTPLNTVKLPI